MDGQHSVKTVSAQEAQALMKDEGYGYLDVRTVEEFSAGHVENAVNIPYKIKSGFGMSGFKFLLTEKWLFFQACQGGMRSAAAAKELKALEFANLVDMAPGFGGWARSGLPSTK
ncbi:thiosulfate sulfurtransferase 16, chloroplastic-like [Selaginella moellendorffii]|uniref:thiosulfate sulfurtransferase 16, chloroplastic-like n=1 Tax=Selaginella moellendorffii TaxID=88036 RepID=UPI000D1CE443|nr:thiosulfate sulfurtransferase 16, chloroplastic-like [Selaginella moellendorffii]|eukprot:XP_024541027.1 thiosulfate sulfurtransferase 16, chloroplastic-like [Selaginella moellendorffii]